MREYQILVINACNFYLLPNCSTTLPHFCHGSARLKSVFLTQLFSRSDTSHEAELFIYMSIGVECLFPCTFWCSGVPPASPAPSIRAGGKHCGTRSGEGQQTLVTCDSLRTPVFFYTFCKVNAKRASLNTTAKG